MKKTLLLPFLFVCFGSFAQVNFISSDLPIIVINTGGQLIKDDPKITADMGIIDNGPGKRNLITDSFNVYNGKIGIEVRGQSSQMFPMKSYGFELRNKAGKSIDQSLFGLPEESDWILYAPYTDKTLMRNFLAYTISRGMGHWASNCRFVEVMLDSHYVGIYVFMEKIKRGSGRVDIVKIKSTDSVGDASTGGYIFSIDKDPTAWYSPFRPPNAPAATIHYSYVYPKPEDISDAQKKYLESQVTAFESALIGPDFKDSVKGYPHFVDVNSFVDFFIVNEVSRNVDGYRLSSFFYKDKDSRNTKIFAGPVWDFDLAFRNANYCDGNLTTGWAYQFNYVCSGDFWQIPFWWNRFFQDTSFQSALNCRWKEMRQSVISNDQLDFWIDSVATLTGEARSRHFSQWPILGQYIWPNPDPIPATYSEEILALKSWVHSRLEWIDRNLVRAGPCSPPPPPVTTADYEIQAWPNPVAASLNLHFKVPVAQDAGIQALNAIGQRIFSGNYKLLAGSNEISLDAASWPKGVYFIRISYSSGSTETCKVIKQ